MIFIDDCHLYYLGLSLWRPVTRHEICDAANRNGTREIDSISRLLWNGLSRSNFGQRNLHLLERWATP
jgi:hypothetical protein